MNLARMQADQLKGSAAGAQMLLEVAGRDIGLVLDDRNRLHAVRLMPCGQGQDTVDGCTGDRMAL